MAGNRAGGRVVGGLFLLAGIGMLIGALWLYQRTREFVNHAVRATGTVVELEAHRDSDGDTLYYPVVEFQDGSDRTHKVKSSVGRRPAGFDVGETVSVLYNLENPTEARIDTFFQLWLAPLLLSILGGVFALIGAAASGIFGWVRRLAGGGGRDRPNDRAGDRYEGQSRNADSGNSTFGSGKNYD